jgi:hypothetical protein
MLDLGKAFFFRSGDDMSIGHQAGGAIMIGGVNT